MKKDSSHISSPPSAHTEGEAVDHLVSLGLPRYEARVYLALMRRKSYTAAEVARESGVPRQRIYDVLDALVRRRLAVLRRGHVTTFSAGDPEIGLAQLMSEQREALQQMERVSTALTSALLPLWAEGRSHSDPLDYIEVLRDPKAIAERFVDIQEEASEELLSFCKLPVVTPAANNSGIKAVRRLRQAGGTVRAIYTNEALGDPEVMENVKRFSQAGEESRFAEDLPLKLVIADASTVLCDMPDPVAGTGATTALCIRHPTMATCLRMAFQTVWSQATTIHQVRAADPS